VLGIVAGSGINLMPLLRRILWERPFSDFPGLSASSVAGHASRFVAGMASLSDGEDQPVLIQLGRRHAYEGLSFEETVRTVDVLQSLGVNRLVFTSAAGGIANGLQVGDVVSARALLTWPYMRFPLPEFLQPDFVLPGAAASGTHIFLHGPCYETPAEIAALRNLDVTTVGMSTAPELLRAQQLGIPAGVLLVVTNLCGAPHHLTHEEVLQAAAGASETLCKILETAPHT
jgi:purine-nucleoside phosphorylase